MDTNDLAAVLFRQVKAKLEDEERKGTATPMLRFQVKVLEAQVALGKGMDRAELFDESEGKDRYSAEVAASRMREAATLLLDAALLLEEAAVDPHSEVLKGTGIKDNRPDGEA